MRKKETFNAEHILRNAVWNEETKELSYNSATQSFVVGAPDEKSARFKMNKLLNTKYRAKPINIKTAAYEKQILKSQQILAWWKGKAVLYPYLQVIDQLQDEFLQLSKNKCLGNCDDDVINRLYEIRRQIKYVCHNAHFPKEPSPDFVKDALYRYPEIPRAWLTV